MFQWLKSLVRYRNPFENPNTPLTGAEIDKYLDGEASKKTAGQQVNESTAMTQAAVWAAVDLISAKIAELPWLWQRLDGESWLNDKNHPTWRVTTRWAGEQTAAQAMQQLAVNLLLYGNAFAWIRRSGIGQCVALYPIHPIRVQMYRRGERSVDPYSLFYQVNPVSTGQIRGPLDTVVPTTIEQANMLHLRHIAPHGHWGLSPIRWGARSIGKVMSAEDYASTFFTNDATPGGMFIPDFEMEKDQRDRLLKQLEERHGSPWDHHKLNVASVPGKWASMGIDPEKAVLPDLLNLGVRDVARIYRLPPHYLSDPSGQAYNSNIEEGKRLLRHTLDPWLVQIEAESTAKLPARPERGTYRAQFDRTQYTRGETTAGDLRQLVEGGIITRNEARERLNLNPVAGGDELVTPLHVEPLNGNSEDAEPDPEANGRAVGAIYTQNGKAIIRDGPLLPLAAGDAEPDGGHALQRITAGPSDRGNGRPVL